MRSSTDLGRVVSKSRSLAQVGRDRDDDHLVVEALYAGHPSRVLVIGHHLPTGRQVAVRDPFDQFDLSGAANQQRLRREGALVDGERNLRVGSKGGDLGRLRHGGHHDLRALGPETDRNDTGVSVEALVRHPSRLGAVEQLLRVRLGQNLGDFFLGHDGDPFVHKRSRQKSGAASWFSTSMIDEALNFSRRCRHSPGTSRRHHLLDVRRGIASQQLRRERRGRQALFEAIDQRSSPLSRSTYSTPSSASLARSP